MLLILYYDMIVFLFANALPILMLVYHSTIILSILSIPKIAEHISRDDFKRAPNKNRILVIEDQALIQLL